MNGELLILGSYACKDCIFYGSCNIEIKPHLCPLDTDNVPVIQSEGKIMPLDCAEQ